MNLPSGPQFPPPLQLLQWLTRPLELMETCTQTYGETFALRFYNSCSLIFFSNPQAIQTVLTADPKHFVVGEGNGILRPLVGDNSVILLDGDRHQRQRHLLMPPFHGERMRTYNQTIRQITEQVTMQWVVDQPFSVRPAMQEISLRVILHAVFGLEEGKRYQQIKQLLRSLLDATGSRIGSSMMFIRALQKDWGPWTPWGQFVRQRAQVDQLLYDEIEHRRQHPNRDGTDILSLMMAAKDEAGQPMTDVELRDELMTLLLAGHETTASALTWALYWVHHAPGVLDKLLYELSNLDGDPDPGIVMRSPYLNAVCQETLRLYPVAPIAFPRILKLPLSLMGYDFEPGTVLAPCIYLTHHRQDLYPEPDQFRPERFLERQFSPYEYIPFGGGNRRCIGMAFAQFEMKLVLVSILSRYHLSLSSDRPVKPIRRGVTLAPSNNLKMVVTAQRQPAEPQRVEPIALPRSGN